MFLKEGQIQIQQGFLVGINLWSVVSEHKNESQSEMGSLKVSKILDYHSLQNV